MIEWLHYIIWIDREAQRVSRITTPQRYDFVGSFLRPQALKDAKAAFNEGKISAEELDSVVNEEIKKVVAKQKELGYHVITDGEFRRTFWHLDFMWGFEGVPRFSVFMQLKSLIQ